MSVDIQSTIPLALASSTSSLNGPYRYRVYKILSNHCNLWYASNTAVVDTTQKYDFLQNSATLSTDGLSFYPQWD